MFTFFVVIFQCSFLNCKEEKKQSENIKKNKEDLIFFLRSVIRTMSRILISDLRTEFTKSKLEQKMKTSLCQDKPGQIGTETTEFAPGLPGFAFDRTQALANQLTWLP